MADQPVARGRVKFFLAEKGWGGIESSQLPHDVFVHFSVIDTGYRALDEGDKVEFRYEGCAGLQDSWQYRATWVRRLPLTSCVRQGLETSIPRYGVTLLWA